jgi:hypothetical protein
MSHRRRLLADQDGFTLVAVTITMMVLGLFAVTTWAAANNALPGITHDSNRKRAYEAAEAGVQWYTFQLEKDTNFWTKCADVPNGVNMQGSRVGWRNVPGSTEQFAIEMMGSTNATTCGNDPTVLLDDGVLTIRVTGRFNGAQRQIVAKFRRSGFIDYIWYTMRETQPPAAYVNAADIQWAHDNCDVTRLLRPTTGLPSTRNLQDRDKLGCSLIQFKDTDVVKGPMHTEDSSFLACGNPTFGNSSSDKIEVAKAPSADGAFTEADGCSGPVHTVGTLVAPSKGLDLPDSNSELANVADYTFSGNTCLTFSGTTLKVSAGQTGWGRNVNGVDSRLQIKCPASATTQTITLQPNTVIWIANSGTCASGYDYYQMYDNPTTCGDVAVSGTYSTNITVGSANDIIINGNLTRGTSDGMMGLVADQFVRVYHPVNPTNRSSSTGCTNNLLSNPAVTQIDAAILATQGSFIADNWDCGSSLGDLKIRGAIAQYWRGTVGTSGNGDTGYDKAYEYDPRLKYREPPEFLDPTTALWNLLLQSEQSPVKSG